jgi:hypothetical protein
MTVYLIWDLDQSDCTSDLVGIYKTEEIAFRELNEFVKSVPAYYKMEMKNKHVAEGYNREVFITNNTVMEE